MYQLFVCGGGDSGPWEGRASHRHGCEYQPARPTKGLDTRGNGVLLTAKRWLRVPNTMRALGKRLPGSGSSPRAGVAAGW